jgi:hypothetical protein
MGFLSSPATKSSEFSVKGHVTCIGCGNETYANAEYCQRCQMPLELSRLALVRGSRPSFIPILGASNAGKTVYIGMLLDMLSKGSHGLVGLPNNALSVAVQQGTISALENRRFPDKTVCEAEEWQWIHCEVAVDAKARRFVDIVTPDLAGEAIALEVDHPGSYPSIKSCVIHASAMIILIDAVRARDGGSEEDLFATKLATYMYQLKCKSDGKNRPKPVELPVAVTFTKSDSCPEAADDPMGFARANLPSLMQYCRRNFFRVGFFASSAVGSVATIHDDFDGDRQIPLHVQPRGIVEPVQWIINKK